MRRLGQRWKRTRRPEQVEAQFRTILGTVPTEDLAELAELFLGRGNAFDTKPLRAAQRAARGADGDASRSELVDALLVALAYAGHHEWTNVVRRFRRGPHLRLDEVVLRAERRLGLRAAESEPLHVRLVRIAAKVSHRQLSHLTPDQRQQLQKVGIADLSEAQMRLSAALDQDGADALLRTLQRDSLRTLATALVVDALRGYAPKALGKHLLRRLVRRLPLWAGPLGTALATGWLAWDWLGPAHRVVTPFFAYLGLWVLDADNYSA